MSRGHGGVVAGLRDVHVTLLDQDEQTSARLPRQLKSCARWYVTSNYIDCFIAINFLIAYAASCMNAKFPLIASQTALTLPDNWDGPFTAVLPVGGAAVTVVAAGILGISALLILSNLE